MTDTPNLPAELPTLELDHPRDVTTQDQLKHVKEQDLMNANNMLKLAYAYIPQVKSITSLCRLIDSTMSIVEKRRKLLCMPYGFESKNAGNQFLDPDD